MEETSKFNARPNCLPNPSLPRLEVWAYAIIWICAAVYSVYALYIVSLEYKDHELVTHYLSNSSWSFLEKSKDVSDFEWQYWCDALSQGLVTWLFGHILLGQVVRWKFWKIRNVLFLWYSLMFTIWCMGYCATLLLIVESALVLSIAWFTASSFLVWCFAIFCMVSKEVEIVQNYLYSHGVLHDSYSKSYIYQQYLLAMTMLRYISLALYICRYQNQSRTDNARANRNYVQSSNEAGDRLFAELNTISSKVEHVSHLQEECGVRLQTPKPVWRWVDGVCYLFYVPLSLAGPTMTFELFLEQIQRPFKIWSSSQFLPIAKGFLRVVLWSLVFNLMSHYLYCSALIREPEVLMRLPYSAVASVGYINGQMFQMKYLVIWALFRTCALLDHLEPPGLPCCVARIALFSEMWKQFDQGLYGFIKTHIYIPIGGSRRGIFRQLSGTVLSFAFINLWHGMDSSVVYWIALNLSTILLETVGKFVSEIPIVKDFETKMMSPAARRRLRSVIITPLLMISSFGIFTFFGGTASGYVIFYRLIIEGFPYCPLILFVIVYCSVQSSKEYENCQARRKISAKLD